MHQTHSLTYCCWKSGLFKLINCQLFDQSWPSYVYRISGCYLQDFAQHFDHGHFRLKFIRSLFLVLPKSLMINMPKSVASFANFLDVNNKHQRESCIHDSLHFNYRPHTYCIYLKSQKNKNNHIWWKLQRCKQPVLDLAKMWLLFHSNDWSQGWKATYHEAYLLWTGRCSDAVSVESLQQRWAVQVSRSYWCQQWQQQVSCGDDDLLWYLHIPLASSSR